MSKVYQCDRCKTIFEPRVLQNGEPYIARKGNRDIDLCPTCYKMLTNWLNNEAEKCVSCKYNEVENKCASCKYKTGWMQKHDKELTKRPTGEWIYDQLLNNWKCSQCGETPKTIGYTGNCDFMTEHFRFCNHCGAVMKGGAEEC